MVRTGTNLLFFLTLPQLNPRNTQRLKNPTVVQLANVNLALRHSAFPYHVRKSQPVIGNRRRSASSWYVLCKVCVVGKMFNFSYSCKMLVAQVAQSLENDHARNASSLENTKHNELQEILQRADILKCI